MAGSIHNIDAQCRLVIPKSVRSSLGIRAGDAVEITMNDGTLVLKPVKVEESISTYLDRISGLLDFANLSDTQRGALENALTELRKVDNPD